MSKIITFILVLISVSSAYAECGRSYVYPVIQFMNQTSVEMANDQASETLVRMGYAAENEKFVSKSHDCFVLIEKTEKSIRIIPFLEEDSSITASDFSAEFRHVFLNTETELGSAQFEVSEEIVLQD